MTKNIKKKLLFFFTIVLLIIIGTIIWFLAIVVDPISLKEGKKFENQDYVLSYFSTKKHDFDEILSIVKEKK